MKISSFFAFNALIVLVSGFSMQAHADLDLIGQGTSAQGTYNLIYDTDLDITWYDYSNYSDTWQNQVAWADALTVNFGGSVYDDWRLPTTVDGLNVWGYDGSTTAGYNITGSEMGHLFYTELGNAGYYDADANPTGCSSSTPWCMTSTGDFQNLLPSGYWSGTEYATITDNAWYFYLSYGYQFSTNKSTSYNALAVRPGRAVVPEPAAMALFLTGAIVLAVRRALIRWQ